jgi:adenine deaminase
MRISFFLIAFSFPFIVFSQIQKAPERKEGEGPWSQLIIRSVILVDGTGAPPVGPVDIVVENNRIRQIKTVGAPGAAIDTSKRPKLMTGGKELDCEGMYLFPGFIDMHGHIGGVEQGTPAEYVFKLWMAHGITTIRDPMAGNGLDWTLQEKKLSAENKITAPRILPTRLLDRAAKNLSQLPSKRSHG